MNLKKRVINGIPSKKRSSACAIIGIFMAGFILISASNSWCASDGSEKYPTKPIELIVPYPAGSSIDLVHRVLAEAMAKELNQSINVINKPGGNSIIGVKYVLDAPSDGYTLLGDSPGSSSFLATSSRLPFKLEDRTFIGLASQGVMTYYVNANSSWKSLREIANAAIKEPKRLTWALLSGTTVTDVSFLQFFESIKLDKQKISIVHFPASGQAVQAVAGGHVHVGGGGVSSILPYVTSGKVRVLAVTGDKRHKDLPDVQTTAEAGFPSLNTIFWIGLSGPSKLPQNVVERLNAVMSKILNDPKVVAKFEAVGTTSVYRNFSDFKTFVLKESEVVKSLLGSK